MEGKYTCLHILKSGEDCGRACWRIDGCYEHAIKLIAHGEYTCNYLLKTGKICGRTCWREEGCCLHWKSKPRIPCDVCGIPTSAKPGLCRNHSGGYYAVQYIKRLREKANGIVS